MSEAEANNDRTLLRNTVDPVLLTSVASVTTVSSTEFTITFNTKTARTATEKEGSITFRSTERKTEGGGQRSQSDRINDAKGWVKDLQQLVRQWMRNDTL